MWLAYPVLRWTGLHHTWSDSNVSINNEYSLTAKLKCGVPQGSVLSPVLLTTYLLQLSEILRNWEQSFIVTLMTHNCMFLLLWWQYLCFWHGKISVYNSLLDDIKFTETWCRQNRCVTCVQKCETLFIPPTLHQFQWRENHALKTSP